MSWNTNLAMSKWGFQQNTSEQQTAMSTGKMHYSPAYSCKHWDNTLLTCILLQRCPVCRELQMPSDHWEEITEMIPVQQATAMQLHASSHSHNTQCASASFCHLHWTAIIITNCITADYYQKWRKHSISSEWGNEWVVNDVCTTSTSEDSFTVWRSSPDYCHLFSPLLQDPPYSQS